MNQNNCQKKIHSAEAHFEVKVDMFSFRYMEFEVVARYVSACWVECLNCVSSRSPNLHLQTCPLVAVTPLSAGVA